MTTRAAVEPARLLAALRDDLADVLVDPTLVSQPSRMFQVLRSPAYAFDFAKLVDLFARDIILAQVVWGSNTLAIFFLPAAVPIIGKA